MKVAMWWVPRRGVKRTWSMWPVGLEGPSHRVNESFSSCSDSPEVRREACIHSDRLRWVPPLLVREAFRSPTRMLDVWGEARKL